MISANPPPKRTAADWLNYALDGGSAVATHRVNAVRGIMQRRRTSIATKLGCNVTGKNPEPRCLAEGQYGKLLSGNHASLRPAAFSQTMQWRLALAIVFALKHLLFRTIVNSPKTIRYRPAAFNIPCGVVEVIHALLGGRRCVRPRTLFRPTLSACDSLTAVRLVILAGVRRLLRRTLIDLSPLLRVADVRPSAARLSLGSSTGRASF